ncbi:MAG: hypothetical protein WEA36_07660 [Balneolaceae bacterium]
MRGSMEICSGRTYEGAHSKPDPGSYEWWYFDGWEEDTQTGFVLIFYEGNPFSSRYLNAVRRGEQRRAQEFPAVSLSVYHRGKPVYYVFEEVHLDDALIQAPERMSMAGCQWTFSEENGEWVYLLKMDHQMPSGDTLTGSIKMQSPPFDKHLEGDLRGVSIDATPSGNHRWNPVQPDSRVSGHLSITGYRPHEMDLSGRGYHDHNVGSEPMSESFERWYWGRFHLPEQTFIYYLMKENGVWERRAWLLSVDRITELSSGLWVLEDKERNCFGLDSPRRLRYEDEKFSLQIDQADRLDNGPFYQRYASRLLFRDGEAIFQSEGISEVIRPNRIDWRWVRPLVDMRIRYPDRPPHWVQRSSRLYRWTW